MKQKMELVETSFVFFAHKILYLASINISPAGLFQKRPRDAEIKI